MRWTEGQRAAIEARNGSVLVSAAAGSGKTAVLVERVLSLLKEGGRIDRKLAQITSRAQFLARRDLEAKALGGVPVRVSQSRTGLRIESRGNCAGGCATNIPHT